MEPYIFTLFGKEIIFYGFLNATIIQIGSFPIKYYGLMYITGTLLAIEIGKYHAREEKLNISPEKIESFGTWVIFTAIIFARAYYVFADWDNYKDNIVEIFAFWKGIQGLAIHGGIIGGAIGALIFAYRNNISYWTLVDIAAAPVLLGQAIGRIGNLINGETHGAPTFTPLHVIFSGNFYEWWETRQYLLNDDLKELVPWGMVFPPGTAAGDQFPNIPIHPTMIYEMILNVIGAALLFFYFRKKKLQRGSLGLIYVIIYAINRTAVTMFRVDDLYIFGFRSPLLSNAIFVTAAVVTLVIRKKYFSEETSSSNQ